MLRCNNFTMTIYDTDKRHQKALEIIKNNYEYATIIHNKDIDKETGEVIKEHRHIVVSLPNARSIKSIAEELQIEQNIIQIVRDKKSIIRYLIHKDNPEKYQYNYEDIETNMNIIDYFNDKRTEQEDIKIIINYIEEQKRVINMKEIIKMAISNNIYSSVRRGTLIIKMLLEENNRQYEKARKI